MDEPQITIRLNVGARASIQAVQSAVDDLARVLTFASDLQRSNDYDIVRTLNYADPRLRRAFNVDDLDFIEEGPEPVDVASVPFVGPIARQVEERALVRVVSLRYQNPLELVILAGGVVVVYVLKMVREWPARRRLNNATATEYENGVIFREEVRSRVLDAIDSGTLPLSPDLVQSLLTDDIASSLGALGDADLKVFGLPGTPGRQDS